MDAVWRDNNQFLRSKLNFSPACGAYNVFFGYVFRELSKV